MPECWVVMFSCVHVHFIQVKTIKLQSKRDSKKFDVSKVKSSNENFDINF